jgi:hypothetical protein
MPDISDYFSQAWMNNVVFFLDVFAKDAFQLLFWNLHLAHGRARPTEKGRSNGNSIRSNQVRVHPPLLSTTVAVDENMISFRKIVSFKTYNPMMPVKTELKMFLLTVVTTLFS